MADGAVTARGALSESSHGPTHLFFVIAHYISPFSFLLCFVFVLTVVSCTKYGSQPSLTKHHRHVALWHIVAVDASYLALGGLYVIRTLIDRPWWPSQDGMTYVLGSVLSWSVFMMSFLETEKPAWKPYFSAIALSAIQETLIFSFSLAYNLPGGRFSLIELNLTGLRIVTLVSLCLHGGIWIRKSHTTKDEEDSQPLLNGDTVGHTASQGQYGTLPVSSEANGQQDDNSSLASDSEDEATRAKQLKQIQERGWWAYLSDFSIIFSYIWFWNDPKQRKWVMLLCFCMFVERFLIILAPRQLGIITNRLIEVYGTGIIPWKEFLLWALYRWLNSSAGIQFLQDIALECLSLFCYSQLSCKAYSHVLMLSMNFHQDKNTGEVLQAIEQGKAVDEILFLGTRFLPMVVDVAVAFWYITYLFDSTVALVVMGVFAVYICFSVKSTSWFVGARRNYVKRDRDESKIKNEGLYNWITVTQFNRTRYEELRYTSAVDSYVDALFSYHMQFSVVMVCQWLILEAGRLLVCFIAVSRIARGEASVGRFVTLITYWSVVTAPIDSLTHMYRTILSALIDAERLLEIFKTEPSVKDREGATELQVKNGNVEFKKVVFSYDERNTIMKDISFLAQAGKTVALVGKTGSGKSTTLKLLSRFYDVTGGSIEIDGQDVRDVTLSSLRESMGIVPQDPSLFNTSIMENVRYARLEASDDEVKKACEAAAIHDKIETFPDKYASKVGERGVKLSGGELQRIAIARVILRNPAIVLLDEATSAVDSETEAQIQESFRKLTVGRTTFVIAHRLSTIKHADLILVFHDGEIVERGTHDELLKNDGKYNQLWSRQKATLSEEGEIKLDQDLIEFDDDKKPPET